MKKTTIKIGKRKLRGGRGTNRRRKYSANWLAAVEMMAVDVNCTIDGYSFITGSGSMSEWRVDGVETSGVGFGWNSAYPDDQKPTTWYSREPGGQAINISSDDMDGPNSTAKWRSSAYNELKKRSPIEAEAMLASLPVRTNVSATWQFDSTKTKVIAGGASYAVVSLASARGALIQLGIVCLHNHGLAMVGLHASANGVRLTDPMPLPKADSYCFEIDVDPKTGQTTLWNNEKGWDMGALEGFQGGGHFPGFTAGTLQSGDHLPSGRFMNCAFAVEGKWQKAELSKENTQHTLAMHQESALLAPDCISFRDLRTAVI